jgi:hypothetical protein
VRDAVARMQGLDFLVEPPVVLTLEKGLETPPGG